MFGVGRRQTLRFYICYHKGFYIIHLIVGSTDLPGNISIVMSCISYLLQAAYGKERKQESSSSETKASVSSIFSLFCFVGVIFVPYLVLISYSLGW